MQVKFLNRKVFLAIAVAVSLTACGGGGSGVDSSVGGSMSISDIRSTLSASQFGEGYVYGYDTTKPYVDAVPQNNTSGFTPDWSKTYRWNISRDGLIPVWGLNTSPLISQALDEVEQIVGMPLFDRNSLANVSEANVKRGILFQNGVPVFSGDQSANCGSSGSGWVDQTMSYVPPMPADWIAAEAPNQQAVHTEYVSMRSKIYVTLNLANSSCSNRWKEIIVHELGHALGLRSHFQGFGIGLAVDPARFNPVLKTLYTNPVGVPYSSLN